MSKLINGENEIDVSVVCRLTDAIRKVSDSPEYMHMELFCVLKQCIIAEPRLKFLIEGEIFEYEQLANK